MSKDIIPCGGGWSAEIRSADRIAISHVDGGLHMAGEAEIAMVHEINRLRKPAAKKLVAMQDAARRLRSVISANDTDEEDGPLVEVMQAANGLLDCITRLSKTHREDVALYGVWVSGDGPGRWLARPISCGWFGTHEEACMEAYSRRAIWPAIVYEVKKKP